MPAAEDEAAALSEVVAALPPEPTGVADVAAAASVAAAEGAAEHAAAARKSAAKRATAKTPTAKTATAPKKAAAKKTAAPKKAAVKKAAAKKAAPAPQPWVDPEGGVCPTSHPVKAKLSSRLYHLPGMLAYNRTRPDRCYATEDAATADGLTKARR